MTGDCEAIRERLPLLRYAAELSGDERLELLDHLERCGECRQLRDELEATAASLDLVPLVLPHPARYADLKRRVLEQVQGCETWQAELLAGDELEPEVRSGLDAHLAACAACRAAAEDFRRVGLALDRWPLERPAGLDGLRQRVLARVGAPATPRGRLLRLPAVLRPALAAAAVLLVAAAAWGLRPRPHPAESHTVLAAIKAGADAQLRAGHREAAISSYRLIISRAAEGGEEYQPWATAARRALESLEGFERSQGEPEQLELALLRYPDSPLVPQVMAQLYHAKLAAPAPTVVPRRFDFSELQELYPKLVALASDPTRLQQVKLLQEAIELEELQQLTDARHKLEELIDLDPTSVAAQRARERLARLGEAG